MSKNDKDSTAGSTIRSGAIAANKGSAKEAFFGLLCGTTFGVTSVLVGHPFDTVKTRMQVLNYNSMGKKNLYQNKSLYPLHKMHHNLEHLSKKYK